MVSNHKDVLDQTLITAEDWLKWQEIDKETVLKLAQSGHSLDNIPDEQAHVIEDGKLRIHVTMPDGEVLAEMLIDESQ